MSCSEGSESVPNAVKEFIAAFREVDSGLPRQIAANRLSPKPYPGLRSFAADESPVFVGRSRQIQELRNRLARQNVVVVLGGSGSGKSSLVKAGLIPSLTSVGQIPGRTGNWYAAEFRPRRDPIKQLFDALWEQVCGRILALNGGQQAFAETLNIPRSDPTEFVAKCQEMIRSRLFRGREFDVNGVIEFSNEILDQLDENLYELRSGPASLLLLIDQFEELFAPETEAGARDDVFDLISRVFEQDTQGLHIAITLRSEELHHCTEYEGLADIINESAYLLNLIEERDLREVIAEPARRVFLDWGIPLENTAGAPFEEDLIDILLAQARHLRQDLNHKADHLPLVQHALQAIWHNAVQRWEQEGQQQKGQLKHPLNIRREDFPELGVGGAGGQPLRACLNGHADAVYQLARSEFDDPFTSDPLVKIAFCTLATRDDRGNPKRRLATLAEMRRVMAVPNTPREMDNLRRALNHFVRSGYVNVKNELYDVSHEALIRSWGRYSSWLDEVGKLKGIVIEVDGQIKRVGLRGKPIGVAGRGRNLLNSLKEWLRPRRLERASEIISEDAQRQLEQIFGYRAIFSAEWACDLFIDDRRGLAAAREEAVDGESYRLRAKEQQTCAQNRLSAIRNVMADAVKWRTKAQFRVTYFNRLLWVLIAWIVAGGLMLLMVWKDIKAYRQALFFQNLADSVFPLSPGMAATLAINASIKSKSIWWKSQQPGTLAAILAASPTDTVEAGFVPEKAYFLPSLDKFVFWNKYGGIIDIRDRKTEHYTRINLSDLLERDWRAATVGNVTESQNGEVLLRLEQSNARGLILLVREGQPVQSYEKPFFLDRSNRLKERLTSRADIAASSFFVDPGVVYFYRSTRSSLMMEAFFPNETTNVGGEPFRTGGSIILEDSKSTMSFVTVPPGIAVVSKYRIETNIVLEDVEGFDLRKDRNRSLWSLRSLPSETIQQCLGGKEEKSGQCQTFFEDRGPTGFVMIYVPPKSDASESGQVIKNGKTWEDPGLIGSKLGKLVVLDALSGRTIEVDLKEIRQKWSRWRSTAAIGAFFGGSWPFLGGTFDSLTLGIVADQLVGVFRLKGAEPTFVGSYALPESVGVAKPQVYMTPDGMTMTSINAGKARIWDISESLESRAKSLVGIPASELVARLCRAGLPKPISKVDWVVMSPEYGEGPPPEACNEAGPSQPR